MRQHLIAGLIATAGIVPACAQNNQYLVRGTDSSWVAWNAEALTPMVDAALLRYLAVAHFGRGRGDWVQGEAPAHWRTTVAEVLAPYGDALEALWGERDDGAVPLAAALQPLLADAARDALERLYPGCFPAPAEHNPPA